MKKKLFLLTVALGAMLFITSCEKDSIIEMTSESAVTYSLGCNLLSADAYAQIPVAVKLNKITLPTSISLNVPPIGNQGVEASSVAWGTAYAGRSISYQNTYGGAYNFSVNIFSPEFVNNLIGSGAYTTDGLDLLVDTGVCTWNTMPYTDVDCDDMPDSAQIAEAANYTISSYATVAITETALKAQLAVGKIIVVAGYVYGAYMNLGYDQVITDASGRNYGRHCYACVGYDEAKQAFKFMNSWGTSWATDGFGWMGYNVIGSYWREAYVLYE
ncbi:MAG: hypothetical protein GQ564_07275 [Bacteroidales bacterium]|nr:hypothetical protein [Bacteroidales bacterium]